MYADTLTIARRLTDGSLCGEAFVRDGLEHEGLLKLNGSADGATVEKATAGKSRDWRSTNMSIDALPQVSCRPEDRLGHMSRWSREASRSMSSNVADPPKVDRQRSIGQTIAERNQSRS